MFMVLLLKQVLGNLTAIYNVYRITHSLCFVLEERTYSISWMISRELKETGMSMNRGSGLRHFFRRLNWNSPYKPHTSQNVDVGSRDLKIPIWRPKSNEEVCFSVTGRIRNSEFESYWIRLLLCVLGKPSNCYEPEFSHLWNGNNDFPSVTLFFFKILFIYF